MLICKLWSLFFIPVFTILILSCNFFFRATQNYSFYLFQKCLFVTYLKRSMHFHKQNEFLFFQATKLFFFTQNEKTMNPFGLSVLNTAAVLPSRLSNITSTHEKKNYMNILHATQVVVCVCVTPCACMCVKKKNDEVWEQKWIGQ